MLLFFAFNEMIQYQNTTGRVRNKLKIEFVKAANLC